MLQNLRQMKCGHCGNSGFNLYTADKTKCIVCECSECGNTSHIVPEPAKLDIAFGNNSEGIICVMD